MGKALLGDRDGWGWLRLVGSIRYTMASGLAQPIDMLMAREGLHTFVIDLREVTQIDSTGLGLLARIGNEALLRRGRRAVIVRNTPDIDTELRAVCFDRVFDIVDEAPVVVDNLLEVGSEEPTWDREGTGRVMLEAHRGLMAVSEKNRGVFQDVVNALERELGGMDDASQPEGSRDSPASADPLKPKTQ